MANNSPTIIAASLSDDQLKKSIDSLVTHVDEAMKKMVQSTNNAVGEMEAKLKSLGNLKIDSGGANDGGASKRAKAQNAETEAVEKTIAARGKQIKQNQETAMSFDQIAAALDKARQTVRDFNIGRQGGLPSADDYKRYEQALARIVEYNDKLKQSALGMAFSNEKAFSFDAKRNIKDMFAVDDRLKQLNKYYAEQEKLSQKATQDEERQRQKRVAAMEKESAAQKKIIDDQYKLSFARTMKIPTDQLDLAQAKLERLQVLLRNMRERGILSNTQIASTEAEIRKLEQIIGQVNTAQQQTTQSAQRYTEEIRKQAAAIRATKEWQEKGHVVVGDVNYYDKERANVSKRDKQLLLSLEEQIVQAQQKEAQEALVAAEAKRQQAQAAKEAAQASKGVSAYDLGIDPNISVGRQRQIESTKKASKETEYLRQQVASLLEVEEREVKSVNITTASYSELSQHLKQLQSAYNKLGADRIKKGEGIDIANNIQRTQRAMQKLQQTMSRPVSLKDALGGSEKTLDDLAYKMRRLQSYRSGLNFKTQSDEVLRVNQKYAELQKKMDVIMERNQRMIASNNALGRSWNYMKNRLAFYVTVGAGTSFIKNLIEVRSQYEMNEKALGILLDSASRGTRIFNELSQMALVSPYTLIELSNAAKQLTAYDIAAKDVVDTTRRLADMASAVGVPVERLTYALGQIKAYGYLNSRDARMFANAGIPLVKQLADRYSELEGKMVSTADVYDRMKKKAIDYNDVMAVINKMTDEGGKFFDFQAKMAETLKVRLANLTLAWNNMLNDMGKDNQGVMTTGLKGLTVMFKHWRELYRIISTVIVALGAYKTASMLVGVATSRAVSSTIPAWFRLANIVRTTQGNMALLGLTMRSIPFTAWFTAIATLASYFILFNNSSDDVKQKLEDIKSAFDGVRKEVETLFADAIKTDNMGTQLTKLRDMLELAETELGVTIPIRLEDVNESNIKQKLKEAKQFVDEYINFSQTFSEAAAGTKFNELMNDFGSKARSTYTNVTESINSVVVALQELSDKGQASKRDIEILNELTSGQKEDESRIEYLQRLVSLYEELGLIGQKKVEPMIGHNFFKAFFTSTWDNMEELEQSQEENLDRLGIKNKSVFENMLKDVQGYYSSSGIAAYQFEQQVMRVAEKIDINNIPVEQRTMKLTAAINEEASQNNWNQFEKEFARQIANEKFGTTIEISDESKKAAEEDLQAWQRNIKEWAKNNSITFDVSFQTNDTEASYAKRMLQEAKDAKELLETLGRKEKQGTGSKDATTQAYNDYIEKRKLAAAAGADLSSLDAKSRKAASKAESELAKALKEELSTIDKVRSIYKDLTKEGMSHANAVERATRGWSETVNAINRILQKNGLQKLDLSKFAGIENPRELVNMLQSQLNTLLKRGAKPAEIKELQTKIQTLNVDAEKYDLTKITKGLNNELGKLKDEYELAVELDANPEMGGVFADMIGIDKETLSQLPKDFNGVVERLQQIVDDKLGNGKFSVLGNLNKSALDSWLQQNQVKIDSDKGKALVAITEYANKIRKDETEKQVKEWDKLLEKYAEYEYKRKQIMETAERERETARKKGASADVFNAIERKERQELTKLDFEEFQKSPEWVAATGDLANMSHKAIGVLINDLEQYRRTAKNLDPKQIKQINKALSNLYNEQRKNNPFKAISNMLQQSRENFLNYQSEIDAVEKEMNELYAQQTRGDWTAEQETKLQSLAKRWKKLKELQQQTQDIDATQWVSAIQETIGAVQQAIGMFNDLAKAIQGVNGNSDIDEAFSVLEKAGSAAAIGAQFGGGWGAAIGGVVGAVSGLITTFADQWSGNKSITEKIAKSERAVSRLELAYTDLEHAIDKAYGADVVGAKRALAAEKELELAELERQLTLERSRKSKNRDEDKIIELQKRIKELRYEIKDSIDEITDDLLGSDVGSFAENLVSAMIESFKKGEDYMEVFGDKFDELIDNMIMKSIVSRVVATALDKLWDDITNNITERSKSETDDYAKAMQERQRLESMDLTAFAKEYWGTYTGGLTMQELYDAKLKAAQKAEEDAKAAYDAATAIGDQDIKDFIEGAEQVKSAIAEPLLDAIKTYYTFGQDAESNLSALQQGIQGITEDTAGALEAYMNGVSQQVYLHSELLTQIRDAVVGMDMDVQVATQAQMLLQLQQSYQVQQNIESILTGVLNPSGRAIVVELNS